MPFGLTFGSPLLLWGLLALPALAGVFAWGERQAGVRLARLIQTPRLRTQLTGAASPARRRVRYALFLLAMGFLVVALAGPRLGYETIPTHRRGLDLIVVVDVSKSMLATDLPPTRLARAKLAVQDFVTQLEGDRVGLVAFAGTAFLQAPLTVDYDAVLNADNELDTEIIPRGGTNLGAAINLAVDAFGKAEAGNRAILLLSDGEPTTEGEESAGLQAAQHAAETGVKIFTLGFGTPEGSLIPLGSSGEFVRDADGKIVRTKLDESTLKAIAKAGNGFYVRFNGDAAIRTVIQQGLSQLKAGEIDTRQSRRPIERYQWPLGIGLALLTIGAFLSERRQARAPLSPGPKAVPTGKRAVTASVALLLVTATGFLPVANGAEPSPAPSGDDALQLYRDKHYDDAYKAFESLAEKHPDQGSLQFNAGASAYMGKQYDEALDAFGKAMTSDNADLQAKANYNFGNTLFRRGADQKERDQKIADWKNALQHYDATLGALKQRGPNGNPRLSTDTAFNRDLVKKALDAALKEPPPSPQNKSSQQNQKQDDKPDKNNQQSKSGQQNKDSQGKDGQQNKDSQGKNGQQNQPPSGPEDQKQQGQDKSGENQPPKPDQSQQGKDQQGKDQQGKDQQGKDQQGSPQSGQSDQPTPQNGGGQPSGQDKQDGNQPPSTSPNFSDKSDGSQGEPKPDANGSQGKNLPNPAANKPREHGDFQAKPGEPGDKSKGQPEGKSEDKPAEAGKMNASQARALLNSLKDEDAHVDFGGDSKREHSNDDPPLKDW